MLILLYSAGLALLAALFTGPLVIPVLHRLKFGQNIREDGPRQHFRKTGTPTMGGIIILTALAAGALLFAGMSREVWIALFVCLGHGVLGFLDDFIKIVMKRSLGLRARHKLLGQIFMSVALTYITVHVFNRGTEIWVPFTHLYVDVGWLYFPLIFLVVIGTTNAVNLTDGLDGLAAGTTAVAALVYTLIAWQAGQRELAVFCAALTGACLGFLRFNTHPAKVFMGDTGSLALGGALAAVAVLTKTELLLILIGGVFVAEALSVIIQVISFKTTGKRVFLMSPLHHHFELLGWPETKVVQTFWLAGAVCGAVGLLCFS